MQRKNHSRFRIILRKQGQDSVHTIGGGRLSSIVVTFLVLLMVIVILTTAVVFGYLIMAVVFTALLIAIVVAIIHGAFHSLRRQTRQPCPSFRAVPLSRVWLDDAARSTQAGSVRVR